MKSVSIQNLILLVMTLNEKCIDTLLLAMTLNEKCIDTLLLVCHDFEQFAMTFTKDLHRYISKKCQYHMYVLITVPLRFYLDF